MCFFEAASPEVVKELNETAKIPFKRIVEAMDLTPKNSGQRTTCFLEAEPRSAFFVSVIRVSFLGF